MGGTSMTEDKRWHLLKDWLLRDLWTKTQACYIYALLIRTEKGDPFDSDHFIEIKTILNEHSNDYQRETREVLAEEYLELWNASLHKPGKKMNYTGRFEELYTKEYCVNWALKKSISLPWLDWAIETKLISLEGEDLQSFTPVVKIDPLDTIGTRKETNLYRLISIMAELMVDADSRSQFSSVSQMISYITEKYKDKEPEQSGLSKKSLDVVLKDARKIRPITRHQ
jgi:hypothetical protein